MFGAIRLPRIIGDHMVLQRNKPISIWGWADAGEGITVQIGTQVVKTKADRKGNWRVWLTPIKDKGPYSMSIQGKNTITIKDILVGEVWLCSGQSNMEWPMSSVRNSDAEIDSALNTEIRFFKVPKNVQFNPVDDLEVGEWMVVTPENISNFSAVGYFFARNLYGKYQFPLGLIGSYWGGTDIETWMDKSSVQEVPVLKDRLKALDTLDVKKLKEDVASKRADLQKYVKHGTDGFVDGKAVWADPNMNDSEWDSLHAPEIWESGPLPDVDGVVWLRKTVILSEAQVAKAATLFLGKIDDSDISWVNGMMVGKTTQEYSTLRRYKIGAGVLKPGKNVITVRVEDTGGGGGIWGEEKLLKLVLGNETISLVGDWKFKVSAVGFKVSDAQYNPNKYPTLLNNGMIKPIASYTLQGVIWYQGENNATRAHTYQTLFPLMIKHWRQQFQNPELTFLYVQLANYKAAPEQPEESTWAELREAQDKALSLPKVGLAVAIDIGDAKDIHPRNKQDVGYRLALAARKIAYGDSLITSSPSFKSAQFIGNQAFITTSEPMVVKSKYGYVMGFQLAGEDRKFYWATAKIEGDKVVVTSDKVANPVAVRYAWADNPEDANLYNKAGLPLGPFRSDDWKGITE